MAQQREKRLFRTVPYAGTICAAVYDDPMRSALLGLKSGGIVSKVEPFGRLLCEAYDTQKAEVSAPDLVTYVPSSILRTRSRGFELSSCLAQAVSAHLAIPCTATLDHTVFSARQASKTSAESRRRHAGETIFLKRSLDIEGKTVLLVDDILASGSTLSACAKLLHSAGAAEVIGLVLAVSKNI